MEEPTTIENKAVQSLGVSNEAGRAVSSAVERRLDTAKVVSSKLTQPTSTLTTDDALAGIESPSEREMVAEKLFFDTAPAHFPLWFSIYHRNPGHCDVYARQVPGKASAWLAAVTVYDERWNPHRPHPRESLTFASIASAVAWIAGELMAEPTGRLA